jgi:hypothetical protein
VEGNLEEAIKVFAEILTPFRTYLILYLNFNSDREWDMNLKTIFFSEELGVLILFKSVNDSIKRLNAAQYNVNIFET